VTKLLAGTTIGNFYQFLNSNLTFCHASTSFAASALASRQSLPMLINPALKTAGVPVDSQTKEALIALSISSVASRFVSLWIQIN